MNVYECEHVNINKIENCISTARKESDAANFLTNIFK